MSGAIWITVSDRPEPTVAYIDDVVIASSTLEEHLQHLAAAHSEIIRRSFRRLATKHG
jgi:hypothetical protein